jgi:hypothetical protein
LTEDNLILNRRVVGLYSGTMFDWLYEAPVVLYLSPIVLIAGAAELGARFRRRSPVIADEASIGTLVGAALGLLALLLAFSFSLVLSRFEARSDRVLEEANAIRSVANFALMLPEQAQEPILHLLRDYIAVRIGLGAPDDPATLTRDVARSVDLQNQLWQQAVAVTAAAPQSLQADHFVAALNEMSNVRQNRLTALRYHVPGAVTLLLIAVAMVATGFTGYYAGDRVATFVMSLTIAVVIMLVIDLDRPASGLVRVPVQALIDVQQAIPP